MPPWALVLLTVATGLTSGLVGSLLTMSHQRHAQVQQQALPAIEAFVVAAPGWFNEVSEAVRAYTKEDDEAKFLHARQTLREATAVADRIVLRVGPESDVAREGHNIVQWLGDALSEVEMWPPKFSIEDQALLQEGSEEERHALLVDFLDEYQGDALAGARVHHSAAVMALDRFAAATDALLRPKPRKRLRSLASAPKRWHARVRASRNRSKRADQVTALLDRLVRDQQAATEEQVGEP